MTPKLILIILLSFFAALTSFAQEAPVYETVIEDVVFNSSSRTVIDEETIKNSRSPDLTTLISAAANIAVTSTPFRPNSIFIRGGDASHVLIVLDGVPFYDASTAQRTLNLNSIDIRSVRKIEIIKGAQTVLYGGQALTAVIKIDTIPKDLELRTGVQAIAGGFEFRDLSFFQMIPMTDDSGFILRGRGTSKERPSPVIASDQKYTVQTSSADLSYLKKGSTDFILKAQYLRDESENPSAETSGPVKDATDFEITSQQIAGSAIFRFKEIPWTPRLSIGAQNSLKNFDWPANATNTTATEDHYLANLRTLRLESIPLMTDQLSLLLGASYIFEEFIFRDFGLEKINNFNEQRGLFSKLDYTFSENFDLNFGLRVEQWSSKDPVSSYQMGLRWYDTKVEYSTGYKVPSSFQLYSEDYGNPDLDAEIAEQVSVSQDLHLLEELTVSATAFAVNYKDLIIATGFGPTSSYRNVEKSQVRGFELVTTYRPVVQRLFQFALGYQEPLDLDSGKRLVRRPFANGSLRWTESFGRNTLFTEFIFSGDRIDNYRQGPSVLEETLPAYHVVNAAYTYRWSDQLNVFARANNLFNNRYEETYTYYVEGVSYQAGLEAWF